ncbi:MAG TPA: hypothetical protein VK698_03475 [Kofleriaceae bacterium]|nr:hypothetical protein [Kofleriaceae bacterium]
MGNEHRREVDESAASRTWLTTDHLDEDLFPGGRSRRRRIILAAVGAVLVIGLVVVLATAFGASDADPMDHAPRVAAATIPIGQSEPPPPPSPPPKWVTVRIGRVEVAAIGPAGDTWDGPIPESELNGLCQTAGMLLTAAVGAGATSTAIASVGCGVLGHKTQRQSDPRDPDLVIRLSTPEVDYRSYVAMDRTTHLFNYEFIVPTAALGMSGIVVSVNDADDDDPAGREIGSTRLDFETLVASARRGEMLLRRSESGSLISLEIEVTEHPAEILSRRLAFDTKAGLVLADRFSVAAGEVVRIEASGTHRTNRRGSDIGPKGHESAGFLETYTNLSAFPRLPHGAAVALIGMGTSFMFVGVMPCERIVSRVAGQVFVGINDSRTGDNSGHLTFRLVKRPPTASEWRRPGAALGCR